MHRAHEELGHSVDVFGVLVDGIDEFSQMVWVCVLHDTMAQVGNVALRPKFLHHLFHTLANLILKQGKKTCEFTKLGHVFQYEYKKKAMWE